MMINQPQIGADIGPNDMFRVEQVMSFMEKKFSLNASTISLHEISATVPV